MTRRAGGQGNREIDMKGERGREMDQGKFESEISGGRREAEEYW